jgi:flagellar protein FliL
MIKVIGFVAIGLLLGGIAAGAVVMGVIPVPFGPMAEARAAAEKARPPVTVMYPTRERVVNLADRTTPRYLKVQLTLEFIDHALKEPPKGEGVKHQQEEFAKEMSAHAAIIEDALTTVLSSKSSTELLKPDGKDLLKVELVERVNTALHEEEKAVGVYFTSFIIQ